MASNNSTPPVCWQSDSFFVLGEKINFAQYSVILPFFGTIGLIGHIILVAVFLKQVKNEKAYIYQIFLEIMECLENVAFSMFLLMYLGSGYFGGVYEWYWKNYFLMWYTSHLSLPFLHGFSNTCLLLSVSMAADRSFALLKPFVYKSINRKLHQTIAFVTSLILGFGTTFFNVRMFEIQNDKDHYIIVPDLDFIGSLTDTILSHICNITRMVGVLALIICNVCILYNFGKHLSQRTKFTNDMKREARERVAQRSLLLLTIVQSFFTAVSMLSYVLFYTAVFAVPLFMVCDQAVYSPLVDCVLMVCDLVKTVVIVVLNRKSREMLLQILCFPKYLKRGRVGFLNTTTNIAGTPVDNRPHGIKQLNSFL